MTRSSILFLLLSMLCMVVFLLDILWGSISISVADVCQALFAKGELNNIDYVIRNFRLPKALTALVAGAGVSITGLQLQCLFRNPLADSSILGINSGAGVGVAFYTMAFAVFPSLMQGASINNTWGVVMAACIGSTIVLLIVSVVASWLKDIISVLIVGVMIGFLASSIISILQFFSDAETLKGYLLWVFGSVSGTTWNQLRILIPLVSLGLFLSLLMPKYMNAMHIGCNYAQSVGIRIARVRMALIAITSLITGVITAFTGPIAFLGIAVPHFTRILFKTSNNRVLIPATILCGATLMLFCDIITQLPGKGYVLPINAVTSLIGAPVVILVIARNRKRRLVFN